MNGLNTIIKIALSILFIICLTRMPYGYYQFTRFAALFGFVMLAYYAWKGGKDAEAIVYVMLAILFQPVFKIALGRIIWNIVDVVVAFGLILSLFLGKRAKR